MFDPYHKWLGIPRDQRPPNHYQLLGIAPDEQDGEVIEEAAIRQTTHVRAYQIGPHAADCTRLLNEIAEAKRTLLDPARRKQYDATLARQAVTKPGPPPVKPSAPAAVSGPPGPENALTARPAAVARAAEPLEEFAGLGDEEPPHSARRPRAGRGVQRKARRSGLPLSLLIGGGVAGVAVLGLVIFLLTRGGGAPEPAPDRPEPVQPVAQKPPDPVKKDNRPPDDDPKIKPLPPDPAPKEKPVPPPPVPGKATGSEWTVERWYVTVAASSDPNRVLLGGAHFQLFDLAQGKGVRQYGKMRGGDTKAHIVVSPGRATFFGAHMDDPAIYCWEVATGRELGKLTGHTGAISRLTMTPDGKYLLSASADKTVRLWDTATFQQVALLGEHPTPAQGLAVSPDGLKAVSGCYKTMTIWDLQKRQALWSGNSRALRAIAFSPDGQAIVTTGVSGSLAVLNGDGQGLKKWVPGKGRFTGNLAFAPNGQYLFAEGADGRIDILKWPDVAVLGSFKAHDSRVSGMAFTPDGQFLFTRGIHDAGLRRWSIPQMLKLVSGKPPDQPGPPQDIPVTKPVVVGRVQGGVLVIPGPGPDQLLFGGARFKLFDHVLNKELRSFGKTQSGGNRASAAFSPDGRKLFAAHMDDPTIYCWEVATGRELGKLTGHKGWIDQLALTPDGKYLVSCGADKVVRLWDAGSFKELASLLGHPERMFDLVMAPDGRRALTICSRKMVLWDLENRRQITEARTPGIRTAAFTPDGGTLLTVLGSETLLLYNKSQTFERIVRKELPVGHVNHIQFTPDGKYLVTRAPGGRFYALEWPTLVPAAAFETDPQRATQVCITRDGRFLIGLTDGGRFQKWPLPGGPGAAGP